MSMKTGKIQWITQCLKGDAFNIACTAKDKTNCPKANGPDLDFGSSPILRIVDGKRIVLAGQKSCVLHAVAGFLGRMRVKTSHLVDAGGKLPVIVIFVDTDEHVTRVLPKLKEMAAHRLIVRENVVMEQGNLD